MELREWRISRGLSARDLGKLAGVSHVSVLAAEDGRLKTVTVARKLSEATGGEVTITSILRIESQTDAA